MGPNGQERPEPGPTRGAAPAHPVRLGTESDAAAAAALHAAQIDQGFLASLGPRFLRRLYRRIVRHPGSFLLVADGPGGTAGFLAGSTDVRDLYRSFLRHDGAAAALPAAGRLLRNLGRVRETLGHGTSAGPGVGRGAELLAVAVDPGSRGAGTGRSLVAAFLDQVTLRGLDAAHVVVGADNGPAVALYRRAGFVADAPFELHPGTTSLLLQWERPKGSGPE